MIQFLAAVMLSAAPASALERNDCRHLNKGLQHLMEAQKAASTIDTTLLRAVQTDVTSAAQQIDAYRASVSQSEECAGVAGSLAFRDAALSRILASARTAHALCNVAPVANFVGPGETSGSCVQKSGETLDLDADLRKPGGPIDQHRAAASGAGDDCGAVPLTATVALATSPCLRANHCDARRLTDAANWIRKAWREEISKPKKAEIAQARASLFPLLNQAETTYRAGPRAGKEKELFQASLNIALARKLVVDLKKIVCD